jgi:hypothetical protein
MAIHSGENISRSSKTKRSVTQTKFDDPEHAGEMETTVEIKAVSVGTELNITQTGIPDMIPVEMCYLGWQESLGPSHPPG